MVLLPLHSGPYGEPRHTGYGDVDPAGALQCQERRFFEPCDCKPPKDRRTRRADGCRRCGGVGAVIVKRGRGCGRKIWRCPGCGNWTLIDDARCPACGGARRSA